jgi:hypothetical protein
MNDSSSVVHDHVCSYQGILSNGSSEAIDAQCVGDDFFAFFVQVGVDQGDVVITDDTVSESGLFFFHNFDLNVLINGISDMLQFSVGNIIRDQETVLISFTN